MQNDKIKKENVHKYHRQRVKERFLKYGLETFSEHQILEMALFFALPHVDTNEMAHHLINKAGSFTRVFDMPKSEMEKISGIKDNASTFLKFLVAFTRYYVDRVNYETTKVGMTYDEIGEFFVNEKNEKLVACFFDENNNMISKQLLSTGNSNSVNVNSRLLIDEVMITGAKKIALSHNHPTFSPVPSPDDVTATSALRKILLQFDVVLIEHFVVSGNKYLGIMKFEDNRNMMFKRGNKLL